MQSKSVKEKIALIYRCFIVLAVVIGVLLQCEAGTSEFSVTSFRMFTTLSNIAVGTFFVVYIASDLSKNGISDKKRNVLRCFKFLITLCIMLTGLVAHFMLREMFADMDQMVKAGLTFLHYIVPIAVVLDWVIFDEKGNTKWKMPLFAALFPVIYGAVSLIVAPFIQGEDKYPYPFLNVDALGAGTVALNIVLLAAAFLAVGYLGVLIDHKISKKK